MTPTRKRRLTAIVLMLAGIGVASTIAFYSLQQNLLFFQSPNDVREAAMPAEVADALEKTGYPSASLN